MLAAFASRKERRTQRRVWTAVLTALLFLPGPLSGKNIFQEPGEAIGATLPFLVLITLAFLANGLWSGVVAPERATAIKDYFIENTPTWAVGVVLGLVWFNGAMALLQALGSSRIFSALLSVLILFVAAWIINRRFGKIIDG